MENVQYSVTRTALLILVCAVLSVSSALSQQVFRAVLDGTQETPSVTATTAVGSGTVELNVAENSIAVTMSFSGLSSNQTASHIHGNSVRGVSSGVLFNIGSNGATSGTFSFNQSVTPADVANLKAGLWYFNVHSTGFPGGEIRGQIEPDCAALSAGLVSWYRGEGNGLDQNALNNGILENGAGFTTGSSGRAFLLDGVDDRVLLGNHAGLQTQDFTIEGWIRRSSSSLVTNNPFPGFDQGILLAYGTGGYGLAIDKVTSKLLLTKVEDSQINAPTLTITDTNFHHVAVTKSGANVTFYVDGVADTTVSYNPTFTFTTNPAIGRRGDANSFNTFFGTIDELSIFSTPLTSSQIASIYNAGAAGKCPPCVATPIGLIDLWSADGNILGARNRNNGVLLNGATYAEGLNGPAFLTNRAPSESVWIPDANSLDVTNNFTLEAWVNPSNTQSGGPFAGAGIISKIGGGGGNNGFQFGIGDANNTQLFCQFNALGEPWPTNQLLVNVPGGIPIGQWTHIACTYNNQDLEIFANGVMIGTTSIGPKSVVNSTSNLRFGGDDNNNVFFNGKIDEPAIYNRALSSNEIALLANAGRSCRCKPTATAAPSGLIGWWGGDGVPENLTGISLNGTAQNGAGYGLGQVGQSFDLTAGSVVAPSHIQVPDNPVLKPSAFTIEAWVKFLPVFGNFHVVMAKGFSSGVRDSYALAIDGNGVPQFFTDHGFSSTLSGPGAIADPYVWHHLAGSFDGTTKTLYLDGQAIASVVVNTPIAYDVVSTPLTIGTDWENGVPFYFFNGRIDEPSLYSRALTATEIQSIFNAGLGGKLKQISTVFNPLAENRTGKLKGFGSSGPAILVGDATIFFTGTSVVPGFTQWMPVAITKLPPLPTQWLGLTYDISTTWQYTGINSVCFNVPSYTPAQFSSLRIYHLESDNWVNRTNPSSMYPNLCTGPLTSLSPFAIGNLVPNAANVNVAGRVLTAAGQGVSNATVFLTDSKGVMRNARTGSLGYFNFENILAGETYVIVIGHKRYTFTPRVLTVEDEITELDIVAIE